MIRGFGGNLTFLRNKFLEATGRKWKGTDHHLRVLTRENGTVAQVLEAMKNANSAKLPDEARYRPLGHVSNVDLMAEVIKRHLNTR